MQNTNSKWDLRMVSIIPSDKEKYFGFFHKWCEKQKNNLINDEFALIENEEGLVKEISLKKNEIKFLNQNEINEYRNAQSMKGW